MNNASYTTLTRQSGLLNELQVIAHNIANQSTVGYRQEGLVFGEYVKAVDGGNSLSMATANIHKTSLLQGQLTQTNGKFDLAIEGSGFFLINTPDGERLTRAGNFVTAGNGRLVTQDGFAVLDVGRAEILIPRQAQNVNIAADGTISSGGKPIAEIGLFRPINPVDLRHKDGVMFAAENGVETIEKANVLHGFLEGSNVSPISQITRMIEVQRAYEMGQKFNDNEDNRIRNALKTLLR